jgi:DNA-3-methyladenine glycosylase
MNKLPLSFYRRENIFQIANELIGKIVVSDVDGIRTSGRIVELEAYNGVVDRASHAFSGKRTSKNETMYAEAGKAYMYICYGIHDMFNVVTNEKDIPHAILIRAVEPIEGVDTMMQRRGLTSFSNKLTSGPGNVCKALGLTKALDGSFLNGKTVFIAADDFEIEASGIHRSARIGMTSAGEDTFQPYRYYVKGNPFVSSNPR